MTDISQHDKEYLSIILDPLATCRNYRPKFGHGVGLTLAEFQTMYQADPFYSWFGLDSPLLYAAHKAGGGMTSVYRQIGIGCQRLIQRILMDALGLTAEQATWSYQVTRSSGKTQTLSLDARIPTSAVRDKSHRLAVTRWLRASSKSSGVSADVSRVLKGTVFEVRQRPARQQLQPTNSAARYWATTWPSSLSATRPNSDKKLNPFSTHCWHE
jgi:hypothetical protein